MIFTFVHPDVIPANSVILITLPSVDFKIQRFAILEGLKSPVGLVLTTYAFKITLSSQYVYSTDGAIKVALDGQWPVTSASYTTGISITSTFDVYNIMVQDSAASFAFV